MIDPSLTQSLIIRLADDAGVMVFAASGALVAARKKQDVVTFVFFAALTGIGGGTVRDLLLGKQVFWVQAPEPLVVCLVTGALVWLSGGRGWRYPVVLWLDSVGLAAYASLGADKALAAHAAPVTAVVLGVLSAVAGGVLRDVIAGEPSILLRREIYITAAGLSATAFTLATSAGADPNLAFGLGFAAGFALRAAALVFDLRMPIAPPVLTRRSARSDQDASED